MSRMASLTLWGTVIVGGLLGLAAAAAGALAALRSAWAVREAMRTQPASQTVSLCRLYSDAA